MKPLKNKTIFFVFYDQTWILSQLQHVQYPNTYIYNQYDKQTFYYKVSGIKCAFPKRQQVLIPVSIDINMCLEKFK